MPAPQRTRPLVWLRPASALRAGPVLAGTVVFAANGPTVRYVFRSELAAVLAAVAAHAPADLPSDTAGAARWTEWVRARDAAVRARVLRAEEDALAYLLVYGTSFTKAPRITRAFIAEATRARRATARERRESSAW